MLLNAQGQPYVRRGYKNPKLNRIEDRMFRLYNELSTLKAPPENPNGYRQIDERAIVCADAVLHELSGLKQVEILKVFDAKKHEISCPNEDGTLNAAVMSPPPFLDWSKPINKTEEKYIHKKPDRLVATMQWLGLALINIDFDVFLSILEHHETRKEGNYTQDIFKVIQKILFQCNMAAKARKAEMGTVTGGIKFPAHITAEGGDFKMFPGGFLTGIKNRTMQEAVDFIRNFLPELKGVKLRLNKVSLHSDCPLYPIQEPDGKPGSILLYIPGIHGQDLSKITAIYPDVHRLSLEEFLVLGPNVQRFDKKRAVVDPRANHTKYLLTKKGIWVREHEFDQLTIGGGSYNCNHAPYNRDEG